jgi:hypothetical protein
MGQLLGVDGIVRLSTAVSHAALPGDCDAPFPQRPQAAGDTRQWHHLADDTFRILALPPRGNRRMQSGYTCRDELMPQSLPKSPHPPRVHAAPAHSRDSARVSQSQQQRAAARARHDDKTAAVENSRN